ncbi:MAG: type II toxin-antitoxin system Phd/YefM family antitoxin [Chloroflexi bacterium]|nr:type II toxin-antitoxin system Phd/YefM family antitoxin [Chloroflexota bacterium]
MKAQIFEKDGRKEFVVLTYEDFLKIQEALEMYEDLRALRKAKQEEGEAPTVSFDQAKELLGV